MAELITKKIHKDACTATRPTAALIAFMERWPNFCATCRATGKVTRSGMELPCGLCMNGRWRCPRCLWLPDVNPNFWPGRCGACDWASAADGAPLADCDCPEEIKIENIRPIGKKATVEKDKRARLEALAGIKSLSDSDVDRVEKKPTARAVQNERDRRQRYGDEADGRALDNRIAEAE